MSETAIAPIAPETTKLEPSKIASVGVPQRINMNFNPQGMGEVEVPRGTVDLEQDKAIADKAAQAQASPDTEAKPPAATELDATKKEYTRDEIKALYEKEFPAVPTPTAEDIKKSEDALDKRMLDMYIDGGGKIDQYSLFKQIASASLTDLSKAESTNELAKAGFTEEEIKGIQQEQYYQGEQSDIDAIENKKERELAQKKYDYGNKKFQSIAENTQKRAVEILGTLKAALAEKDLQIQKENEFVSNVEAHFEKLNRKMALELGKVDDTDIAPVQYNVPESVVQEAKNLLKDKELRKQFLYNKDGSLNLENLSETILKSKMFDSATKTAYLEGGDRQVDIVKKTFGATNPNALGVGGSPTNPEGKGKVISAGKPQRVRVAV